MTTFPTAIDTLTNPLASDKVSIVSHSSQHGSLNDAVEALEAKVGVDSSAVATSLDYLIKNTSSKLGKIASLAVTDGNIIVGNGTTWVEESGATARTSLGLGTGDSPTFATVNIIKSSVVGFTANGSSFLTVQNNGVAYIEIGTPNNSTGRLLFSDPEGASGQIVYNHSTNVLSFNANDAERLSIDSAGLVTVTGNINNTGVYQVDGVQVVGNRVVDARCDDAINSGDATTDGVIDSLRDAMIAHGLIAAA